METTPDSNNGNSEKAPWKPWTEEERQARLQHLENRRIELQDKVVKSLGMSLNEYDAFKADSSRRQMTEAIREESVEAIAKTPEAVVPLVENDEAYKKIIGAYNGDWKLGSSDPDVMRIVRNSTVIEKAALSVDPKIVIPEGYKKRGQPTKNIDARIDDLTGKAKEPASGTFPERGSIADTDAIIARLEARNAERAKAAGIGKEIKVNNFTTAQQDAARVEWSKNNPNSSLDIDLTKPEIGEPKAVAPEVVRQPAVVKTPEQQQKIEADYLARAKESLKSIERVMPVLEERKEAAKGKLLERGLTGLAKGLEAFSKVSPRKKAAIGLMLAGASVATGGMTSILSKGLSTMSYASSHYNEKLQANEKAGLETNKKKLAVQSFARGLILSLATSYLISILSENVDMGAVVDGVVEKASALKESIKEMVTGLVASAEAADLGTALHDPTAINGLDLDQPSTGETIVTPAALAPLSEYTIKPGDNLTNIIRQQILPTIPGVENLTELQKNNLIENYLKEAAKYRDVGLFNSVNQFANPGAIQPGAHLDLEMMRKGMTELKFPNLGGGSLLDHAKTITGSVSGSVAGSSAVTGQDLFNNLGGGEGISHAQALEPSQFLGENGPTDDDQRIRVDQALEPSQILDESFETRGPTPYDDSTDNPRIRGLGYRNNA